VLILELTDNHMAVGRIYDSNGSMIKSLNINPGVNTFEIRNLAPGIYYIKILSPSGNDVRKIIKQ